MQIIDDVIFARISIIRNIFVQNHKTAEFNPRLRGCRSSDTSGQSGRMKSRRTEDSAVGIILKRQLPSYAFVVFVQDSGIYILDVKKKKRRTSTPKQSFQEKSKEANNKMKGKRNVDYQSQHVVHEASPVNRYTKEHKKGRGTSKKVGLLSMGSVQLLRTGI